jgi:hypothetical protein
MRIRLGQSSIMVAISTIAIARFALAMERAAPHKERAFQASSPKTQGLARAGPFFVLCSYR